MRLAIYLPTHNKETIRKYADRLTDTFGGCTVYPNCEGYWLNPKLNRIERDPITVLEVFTKEPLRFVVSWLELLCFQIKDELKQTCVAYALDNEIYFVS